MPHVLILDDSDVACLALRGILNEQGVGCTFAASCLEAWSALHRTADVSMVITEAKLKSESPIPFLERIRSNAIFRALPVLVYSSNRDVAVVKSILSLRPQNYLLKPYRVELLEHEIQKAHEGVSSTEDSIAGEELQTRQRELAVGLSDLLHMIPSIGDVGSAMRILPKIKALWEASAEIGDSRVEKFLRDLVDETKAEHWTYIKDASLTIEYVARILGGDFPATGQPGQEDDLKEAAPRDLALWTSAEAKGQFPLDPKLTLAEADALNGVPVVDTMSAAFSMTAEGSQSSLSFLNELVSKDASLSAAVLIAANHLAREGDLNDIENPAIGVSMLGDVKLVALARNMPRVSERSVATEHFSWGQYHRFQVAVGRMAEFIRRAVEFKELEPIAYTAGLIHDVGQLALMRIYPHGFRKMVEFAAERHVTLTMAAEHFLGLSASAAAAPFLAKHGLPAIYCSVVEHWKNPSEAPAPHADMVAIVSLARFLCEESGIGKSGDFSPFDRSAPLEKSRGWEVLRERVFPSFNTRAFHTQAMSFGRQLKEKLNEEDTHERAKTSLRTHEHGA